VDVHTLTRTALGVVRGCRPPPDAHRPLGLLLGEDLLPGWDEDWVLVERERLRQLRLRALDALAEALVRQGRPALATEAAWASVRAEPLRESAHRAVVSAHLAEGNISEAVRHYHAFRRLLNEELGVESSPRFARMLPGRIGRSRGDRSATAASDVDNSGSWGESCHTVERWRCITTARTRGG
jgi:DNA-binding SARP family transcriptional activator